MGDDDSGGDGVRISQAIQAPSLTHPGTTYPVRVSPHTDYIGDYMCFYSFSSLGSCEGVHRLNSFVRAL